LIHELREHFPEATLDALVLWRGSRDLLETNPHLNRVHQRNLLADSPLAALRYLLRLRREGYDLSFNTHPQSRVHYRLVAGIIGARTRISHRYDNASLLDSLLTHRALPQDYSRHAIENNLALLELIGLKPRLPAHSYELFLTRADTEWAERFITAHGLGNHTLLGIHVGSGGTKNLAWRRWPLEHYIELIRRLTAARPGLRVLLLGGPEEQADHAHILAQTDRARVFQPATENVRQAAALLRHCRAFLSVDTALMHVAAAMRVPGQVVIETPTWNKPIEPHGNRFVLVPNRALAGRNLQYYRYDGRGIRGTREEIARLMRSVTVEAVEAALSAVLQEAETPRPVERGSGEQIRP
ncbi:MAG: glycosyltransferase family 9 protein, partial [Verrucomicrobiales bacterium]|nr:glycosyltransferase family 9 protein [Verrucomicrobiales bacterium]